MAAEEIKSHNPNQLITRSTAGLNIEIYFNNSLLSLKAKLFNWWIMSDFYCRLGQNFTASCLFYGL